MIEKLKKIRSIVFDIDGVLTNGMIWPFGPNEEDLVRVVDAKDAFGARAAASKGFIMGIISGGRTEALHSRCLRMGVKEDNVYLGTRGKIFTFEKFCKENGLNAEEVAYFGDDIPDVEVLKACGVGIVPADAAAEAKAAADYICTKAGGRGAVREGVELILKAQGKWNFENPDYKLIY